MDIDYNIGRFESVKDILEFANGKDGLREGVVFKSNILKRSFKAISNEYLIKDE